MGKFALQGEVQLKGSTTASGAKNAALPVLAAAMLCRGTSVIHRVPDLSDIRKLLNIMRSLGAEICFSEGTVTVNSDCIQKNSVPAEAMREMRASVLLLGALLARCREAFVAYPGGCSIGQRPIDLHIKAFKQLGAEIEEGDGIIAARAKQFTGGCIILDFPSVGATENAVLLATAAQGVTIIKNAAREPEIIDMADFLCRAGAAIKGAGTDTIVVDGGRSLTACEHTVMPDRIEAGTLLVAGSITGGDVTVEGITGQLLTAFLDKLAEMGTAIDCKADYIRVRAGQRSRSIDFHTQPYPGFPTDLQAVMMAALTVAEGTGTITETIFENRFQQAVQLNKMGADISVLGRRAIVHGVPKLHGAEVAAPDLRAGAALILAGLNAAGTTIINDIRHIERGYEQIDEKLRSLGAIINRQA